MAEDRRAEDGKMHFKAQIGEDHTSLQARSQLRGLFLFLAGFSQLCFDPRWHGYTSATKARPGFRVPSQRFARDSFIATGSDFFSGKIPR